MKEILVAREYDDFSRILNANGFRAINLPLIETTPLPDLSDFETRLSEIENYDGVFLTSSAAARIFADKMLEKNIAFNEKVYVLGRRSFEILNSKNLDLFFDEDANTAREMLEKIPVEHLKDKRFLFVRGDKSLRVVPDFLKDLARVNETIVYETGQTKIGIDKINAIRKKFAENEFAAACFFSPSAAESFIERFGAPLLHQTKIATIGETTAEFFERQNLRINFVSPKANAESFAIELIEYLKKRVAGN